MNANCRYRYAVFLVIALGLAACATTSVRTPSSLANAVAKADAALNHRPISLATYNAAVREICVGLAVLRYETKNAPLYPPEGLFVDACVLYQRDSGEPRVEIQTQADQIVLAGKRFQIAENPIGAGDQLKERAKRLAKSGFMSMIRPAAMQRKPQIYLLDRNSCSGERARIERKP